MPATYGGSNTQQHSNWVGGSGDVLGSGGLDADSFSIVVEMQKLQAGLANVKATIESVRAEMVDGKEVFGVYTHPTDPKKNGLMSLTVGAGATYSFDTGDQSGSVKAILQHQIGELDRRVTAIAKGMAAVDAAYEDIANGPLQRILNRIAGPLGALLAGNGFAATAPIPVDSGVRA